jgi:hypothetical protein
MITREDCIAMCGLDAEQVDAISEHEHLDIVPATALASYLLHRPKGESRIRTMIIDDIHRALAEGRKVHAAELVRALHHFLIEYPGAGPAEQEDFATRNIPATKPA